MSSHPAQPTNSSYLLVFSEGSTAIHSLPPGAILRVGRAADADVRTDDLEISDENLVVRAIGSAVIAEPSPNSAPVMLNGALLSQPRPLTSGDVLSVSTTTLAFHRAAVGDKKNRAILDVPAFQRRLLEETERSLRYGRPLAVLALSMETSAPAERASVQAAISRVVRLVDVVCADDRGEFMVLFPESDRSAAIPARRVVESVASLNPDVRAGLARCPEDASDVDSLITAARLAARASPPATVLGFWEGDNLLHAKEAAIVAADPLTRTLFKQVERIARSDIPVLIMGDTGVGKEVVAQALHAWSRRADQRLVAVNCAAMAETLLESELFGHERGAFTGAVSAKAGVFELGSGGTVFLDEIGEASPRTQAELLRVLETKRFCRVGSQTERTTNVRIIAATNCPLEQEIEAGRFRRDLFFRLNAASLVVPPLRDRHLDLPVLARAMLHAACAREGRDDLTLSSRAMQRLALHGWPGNVRELKNVMDFAAATCDGPSVDADHLPAHIAGDTAPWLLPRAQTAGRAQPVQGLSRSPSAPRFRNIYEEISELERTRIKEALAETAGVKVRAADLIGMPLRTFLTKMKKYGLSSGSQD